MSLIFNLFAQATEVATEPTNWDQVFKLIEYLFNNGAGLGTFGVILGITQVAMFALNKSALADADFLNGKLKIVLVAFITLIASVCTVKIANPTFGVWSIAFSSVVLTALQSFAFSIYKEFFKKS